jgi:integrase
LRNARAGRSYRRPANAEPIYLCQKQSAQPDRPNGTGFLSLLPKAVQYVPERCCGKLHSGHDDHSTNLRKEWHKACVAAGLGRFIEVEGKPDPKYTGLIIHDLRRSAIKNLMKAGVNEKVAMKISGHKTRDVFDRYHIVDTEDVVEAMRRVQQSVQQVASMTNLVPNGERLVKIARRRKHQKLLTASQ